MNKYRTNNFESCGQIALWVLRKLGLFFYGQNLEINTQSHFQFEYLEAARENARVLGLVLRLVRAVDRANKLDTVPLHVLPKGILELSRKIDGIPEQKEQ